MSSSRPMSMSSWRMGRAHDSNQPTTMKTELQKSLAVISGMISIDTFWEHDPNARFHSYGMTDEGGCFHGEDEDDWTAWQSEVKATAIVNGEIFSGSAYLGGTWELSGGSPRLNNPTISGYENQMTKEALSDLLEQVSGARHPELASQIGLAINHIKQLP